MKLKDLLETVNNEQFIQIADSLDLEIIYYENDRKYFNRESIENKQVIKIETVNDVLRIEIEV